MQGFEPVVLGWAGSRYVIQPEGVLPLIASIEDILMEGALGLPAVSVLGRPGGPGNARLARCYGAALRHAGAAVSDDEIYLALVGGLVAGSAEAVQEAEAAAWNLMLLIAPPVGHEAAKGSAPGKPDPAAGQDLS